MAITDINISEQLQTDAPSIKYTGNEGPQNPQQQQQEMQIAQQIWEALGPEQQSQFQSFEQFFQSGVWKQILQQMQADEAQGIAGLGPNQGSPNIMERATTDTEVEDAYGVPVGAAHGGRIGYRYGKNYKSNQGSDADAKLKHLKAMGASDEEIYNIIVKGKDMSDHYRGIESLRGQR